MFDISELDFYDSDFSPASFEDFVFYHDELLRIRSDNCGILCCWIVPDEDCGHIEFRSFSTWDDLGIWINQK